MSTISLFVVIHLRRFEFRRNAVPNPNLAVFPVANRTQTGNKRDDEAGRCRSALPAGYKQTCDALRLVLAVHRNGVLEYWGAEEFGRPPAGAVSFKFKMDTDLYDLAKAKARPCSISFSPDGNSMAVTARDKQVTVGKHHIGMPFLIFSWPLFLALSVYPYVIVPLHECPFRVWFCHS